jgi:hypothetical protein
MNLINALLLVHINLAVKHFFAENGDIIGKQVMCQVTETSTYIIDQYDYDVMVLDGHYVISIV